MIQLPTDPQPPLRRNPKSVVLYGPRKLGKSTLGALLPDAIHLDTQGGTDYLTTRRLPCESLTAWRGNPFAGDHAGSAQLAEDARQASYQESVLYALRANRPRRLVVDMINEFEEWAIHWATDDFRRSIQGASFKGDTVEVLPKGLGYGLIREKVRILWRELESAAEELVVFAHQKDTYVEGSDEKLVSVTHLDLVGKTKQIVASAASATGYLYRKDGMLWVTFHNKAETLSVGNRIPRLESRSFVLSWIDLTTDTFCHGWEQIFLPADGSPPDYRTSTLRRDPQAPLSTPTVEISTSEVETDKPQTSKPEEGQT